jgi:predicted CoA-binding protein
MDTVACRPPASGEFHFETCFVPRHPDAAGSAPSVSLHSPAAFLRPRSVALVGASDRLTSTGGAVLRNLLRSGFKGRIVPIHPKGGELLGVAVVRSLAEVSPPCDLAVIVVRPDAILDVVREAAASGHRNLPVWKARRATANCRRWRRSTT